MLKKIKKESMGHSDLGWLQSLFHFSFAEYRNPDNINFGVLRVLNDDIIKPQTGFDTHPHQNMEIISYIINGEITHKDSMGNKEILKRGEVQYMSAGDGIFHSEYNEHQNQELRLLQIWITPPRNGLPKLYGSKKYTLKQRENQLLNIVSSQMGNSEVKIHQDVNIYVSQLEENKTLTFDIEQNRQLYFVQIEGQSQINSVILEESDAVEITKEAKITIQSLSKSHFLFIEMKQEDESRNFQI